MVWLIWYDTESSTERGWLSVFTSRGETSSNPKNASNALWVGKATPIVDIRRLGQSLFFRWIVFWVSRRKSTNHLPSCGFPKTDNWTCEVSDQGYGVSYDVCTWTGTHTHCGRSHERSGNMEVLRTHMLPHRKVSGLAMKSGYSCKMALRAIRPRR